MVVELHWEMSGLYTPRQVLYETVSNHLSLRNFSGQNLPNLSTEHLVVYLSVHACKHGWANLEAVANLSELLKRDYDLDKIVDKANIIDAFFSFAQAEQKREAEELINSEELNEEAAKRYILASLKREYASENGTELNEILPKMSPLNPKYLTKKQSVFQKIAAFVEKFKGVGGKV